MKANWTPPKAVIQLTYRVSKKEIERLAQIDECVKSRREKCFQATVRIKCGKQADSNYKKWDHDPESMYILNFYHDKIHVYMKLGHVMRIFHSDFGIGYKLFAYTIKELPK